MESVSQPGEQGPAVIRHSLYDLFLEDQAPSPTRWLLQNAEDMPKRLEALLGARQHSVATPDGKSTPGWLFAGVAGEEIVRLKSVRWEQAPDLMGALNQEANLSRSLRIAFEITSVDGRLQTIERVIPNLPFPTPWGTYVTGANQELLANKLVQKPGVFPVNLSEATTVDEQSNAILWHTTTASVLQTKTRIVAIARSLTNALRNEGGRNKAIVIPRAAWVEFDEALKEARSHQRPLTIAKYPQLVAAFKEAHRVSDDTKLAYPLSSWIREIAHAGVPAGSWQKRLDRLGITDVGTELRWSIESSRCADRALDQLPHSEFLGFSSLGRMKVQTGADILAEMLAQLIAARIQEVATAPERGNQPARAALSGLWASTNWRVTQDLIAATQTGTDRQLKTLANEKTPAETAIRVLSLIREGHVFGQPEGISAAQRETDTPSTQFFLSAVTMENASVGNALHMLPKTRVRETGELEAPFTIRDGMNITELWLNNEELENLEEQLATRGLGIAYGKPDSMPGGMDSPVNLHYRGQVINRVPKGELPAWFDASPEDMLPLGLRMLPDNARVEVARHFIALAFVNGASSCNGSEPDPDFSEDAKQTCAMLLNTGKFVRSPVAGTIEALERKGRIGTVILRSANGEQHAIDYPVDLSNAFSNATGMTCVRQIGDHVNAADPLLVPDQACVVNSVKLGTPGVFPAVPLRAAEFSIGEEDLLVVSAGAQASSRLTIMKQGNTAAINGVNGPIRLAIARPGTMILPGMVLAWQNVANADGTRGWREIKAGESDRGILANIFVVPDKSGQGSTVEIAPEALARVPSLPRQIRELLTAVECDFTKISEAWRPETKQYWAAKGHDVTAPYEQATMHVWSHEKQQWDSHVLTLGGIKAGAGHPEYELLTKALERPTSNVFFGGVGDDGRPNRNFLESRLHFTHAYAERIAERIALPPPEEMPTHAKRVAFSLIRELPISDGDKGAALGTKGSLIVVHPQNLPMTVVKNQVTSPDVSYSVLGFLARSSYGDMEAATKGQNAATLDSVVFDPNRGLIQVPVRYGTYRFLRQGESNPDTAASSRGIPSKAVDLTAKATGFSADFQATDGRNANRVDHTLMADARPALEVGYAGNRDSGVFLAQVQRVREELVRDLPMVRTVEPGHKIIHVQAPTVDPLDVPSR